ncbi:MAG TPA: hypothetical protein VFE47_18390 [Tepidisphaeraceae bacterium]|jgi:hypothetical protein|nr:hypothetical protein [Tepidisphaeraceae bacterium]
MSDTSSLSQSLHAMLAAHAGAIAVGSAAPGEQPITPDDDALETPADATPAVEMLRTQQQYALEDLMAGKSYTEAAATAGVNRRTLFRWVNHDPAFRAALEAWRLRAARTAEDRLTQAAHDAAATLSTAATRDFRAAAILLKGRGLLPGPKRQFKPLEKTPLALTIPPGKRRDFEIRLRELILSFRDEGAEAAPVNEETPRVESAAAVGTEEVRVE